MINIFNQVGSRKTDNKINSKPLFTLPVRVSVRTLQIINVDFL